jgi:hypothetical protein
MSCSEPSSSRKEPRPDTVRFVNPVEGPFPVVKGSGNFWSQKGRQPIEAPPQIAVTGDEPAPSPGDLFIYHVPNNTYIWLRDNNNSWSPLPIGAGTGKAAYVRDPSPSSDRVLRMADGKPKWVKWSTIERTNRDRKKRALGR